MATFTQTEMPAAIVPRTIPGPTDFVRTVSFSTALASVTATAMAASDDIYTIAQMPPGARILDASMRATDAAGVTGSKFGLVLTDGSSIRTLIAPVSATGPLDARMTVAPPPAVTGTPKIAVITSGGRPLTSAAAAGVEFMVLFDTP